MAEFSDKIQVLMDEVYNEWREADNKGKWEVLEGFSEAHKIAVAFGNFNYQVENGGIEQWIYNGYFHDDSEKFIEYLETGAQTDERCRTILDRVSQLDQYANETGSDRYGDFYDIDNEDGDSNFIGDAINCNAFDSWYYENCGKEDWWEAVCGIIDKAEVQLTSVGQHEHLAYAEIYKLKRTVSPEVREQGMFEFFGMVDGPLPKNYVREWAGELESNSLDLLCGKFFLNPPEGYHGGPLDKSDIVVMEDTAYFLERNSGYKFTEVTFDTSEIKNAIHVDYGRYVSVDDAASIPRTDAIAYNSLDIPIGYLGEPGYHGSSKGISDFSSFSHHDSEPCYLHPQFLAGDDARDFVSLFKNLLKSERWPEIADYLRENTPIYMSDLESAQEQFVPELLLPIDLRPLSKFIPIGTNEYELSYLSAKLASLDSSQRNTFDSIITAERHCGSVAELINLTENLDYFTIRPIYSEEQYGQLLVEEAKDNTSAVFTNLEKSEYSDERDLAQHILKLEAHIDYVAYAQSVAIDENGIFTKHGYITEKEGFREVYRGTQDLSDEHCLSNQPAMRQGLDVIVQSCNERSTQKPEKPSVLEQLRESKKAAAQEARPQKKTSEKAKSCDPEL